MSKNFRTIGRVRSALILSFLMFLSFLFGNITGFMARPVLAESNPPEFQLFWEAWALVEEHFVDRDRIDPQAMTFGAIRGMLDSLGDENHTVFFTPQEAEQQTDSMEGSFEGIGAYVAQENGLFRIVSPILGSPAESAGILAGDLVIAVDGEEISGQPQWEVISKIRGPSGTSVILTVVHPDSDDTVDIEIVRGRIDIKSVLWSRLPETDLAYLQITQFAADTNRELLDALDEIDAEQEPVRGILLDLRNNPGGFLRQALLVGSQFLDEGEIILHERDARDNISTYKASGPGAAREVPLVVLINEGSASAAEILAGALQENGRAKLVGETTLGTGTVLRPYTLSDGSVLRLGITNWLTPEQKLIKGKGIHPNIAVSQAASVNMIDSLDLQESDAAEIRQSADRQFNMGVTFLKLRAK